MEYTPTSDRAGVRQSSVYDPGSAVLLQPCKASGFKDIISPKYDKLVELLAIFAIR